MTASLLVGLASIVGFAPPAVAQTDLGVVLGVSRSSLRGDTPPNGTYTTEWGPILGLSAEFGIGDGLYLIAQPQYVTRGTRVAFAVEGQTEPQDSLTLSLSYVSIPMGLKVRSESGRWYASSVLDLGILTSATFDNGSSEEDVKDSVDSVDLAVGLGVGRQFSIGRRPMTIELRYSQSLMNLLTEGTQVGGGGTFPGRFRVSGLQLVAGLYLGLGGAR
jgi:hypothetical protein